MIGQLIMLFCMKVKIVLPGLRVFVGFTKSSVERKRSMFYRRKKYTMLSLHNFCLNSCALTRKWLEKV